MTGYVFGCEFVNLIVKPEEKRKVLAWLAKNGFEVEYQKAIEYPETALFDPYRDSINIIAKKQLGVKDKITI